MSKIQLDKIQEKKYEKKKKKRKEKAALHLNDSLLQNCYWQVDKIQP